MQANDTTAAESVRLELIRRSYSEQVVNIDVSIFDQLLEKKKKILFTEKNVDELAKRTFPNAHRGYSIVLLYSPFSPFFKFWFLFLRFTTVKI